jgi:hypothetical protein
MKHDRFYIKHLTVKQLKNILLNKKYIFVFIAFQAENYYIRYKLNKPKNFKDLTLLTEKDILYKQISGVNSDDFNFLKASYIDCYFN